MLNIITICGRLTKDPDLRMTQSQKPVASFTVACERDYAAAGEKREADFIDCVAWNNTADFVSKWFAKGSMAIVVGRLQSRDWTDREGGKRRSWEIIADRVYFGEAKKKDEAAPMQEFHPAQGPVNVSASTFEELNGDGELPF